MCYNLNIRDLNYKGHYKILSFASMTPNYTTMKKFIGFVGALSVTLLPAITFAQSTGGTSFFTILGTIKNIIGYVGPILMGFMFVYFVWNVVQFIMADAEKKTEARDNMLWSIVGFVVVLGLYGIINVLFNTFGVQTNSQAGSVSGNLPTFSF